MSKGKALLAVPLVFVFALGFGFGLSSQTAYAVNCNCQYKCVVTGEKVLGVYYSGQCNYWPACDPCDPY